MDIQDILDTKIRGLPSGAHDTGLRAVKSHIDAAVRHFLRGQAEPDETLFTDVIFRCNQAFEGSIKEAYRVIAGQNPDHVRPFDIEKFLSEGNLLRKKVLDQFTRYRQEWRNPSAHDYTLDFDEDEALLAIVSVTTFAIVLCDQIDSKIAFDAAAAATPAEQISLHQKNKPLLELVTQRVLAFAESHIDPIGKTVSPAHDYYRLEGALAGYLSADLAQVSGLTVEQNKRFASSEADIVISRDTEKVVIELKRMTAKLSKKAVVLRAITQVALYLHEKDVVGAVVLVHNTAVNEYEVSAATGALAELVRVVTPRLEGPASTP
ncbi:hypothetical protein AYJ54_39885 [Bradyrhizobium centrolobii]|uniref:Uncharacterized protein n=1 Tax=Bradyrhizobium centrolobii TaxID=1505087 RepID=A0A176Z4E7_9BRAD|nr:hypothetical protein [Bradyrhizobium centrolobii]OAF15528.1 hypothetical protein AYJ54_39885 [Bradyrhizobium centrolobii]